MPKSRVTIREVSRLSGVSIATVSRVINRLGNVSPETEARVRQAIESLSYHADPLASGLKSGSSRTIGVVLPRFDNDYFMRALKGIDEVFSQAEYSLMLAATHNIGARERQAIANMLSFKAAGLIVATSLTDAAYFESIDAEQCPIVLIDRVVDSARLDMIAEDHLQPSRAVAQRLVDAGHRRIAIFGGSRNQGDALAERYLGAREACEAAGVPFDESRYVETRFSLPDAYGAARAFFPTRGDTTAVFAMSDLVAMGVIRALKDMGKRVPEDVSVFGFDGIEMGKYFLPSLTTIVQPQEEIARKSVEVLLEMMTGGGTGRHITLPAALARRESVAAPRK